MIKLLYYRHNTSIYHPAITTERINYSELTIVIKGELRYKVNDTILSVKEGNAIYIKEGSTRQRKQNQDADYVSFNFLCDIPLNLPLLYSNSNSAIVLSIINTFDLIFNNQIFDLRFINKTTAPHDDSSNHLFIFLLKQLEKQYSASTDPPLIQHIKTYIQENITNKITLNDISSATHYSVSHCSMHFKQKTGLSIIEYINKKKVALAKVLLLDLTYTLSQIADAVGFPDYNYFSRVFKKETGLSPINYRNSYSL